MSQINIEIDTIIRLSFNKVETVFNGETTLRDLGIDSLDMFRLVVLCEEKFNIKMDDADIIGIHTVDDLIYVVETKVKEKILKM